MKKPGHFSSLLCFLIMTVILSWLVACAPPSNSVPPAAIVPPPAPSPAPKVEATPAPTPSPTPAPSATPQHAKKPERGQRSTTKRTTTVPPDKPKQAKWEIPQGFFEAALWGNSDEHRRWTETVIRATWRVRADLEEAKDIDDFCPGYDKATQRQRSICWLRIVSGIVKEESQFKPRMTYREPMGMLSVGLMQLSDGECILNGNTAPDLKDPLKNLKCGIAIMASLTKRDRYIDGPIWARGAASYWSTLRKPYIFLGMQLGRRSAIVGYAKNYRSFPTD